MARGQAIPIELSAQERAILQGYTKRRNTARILAKRSEIILLAADGMPNQTIAQQLRIGRSTVMTWRKRFSKRRLDGLHDEPRPGAPRRFSDTDVEHVITMTLEERPKGATHWSTRTLAKRIGMSNSTVGRIWRAFGLAPHRSETFTLSNDPLFVEKVRDIVGLYLSPPENALVLCVDEKSQIQALNRKQPILPLLPGQFEKRTASYQRHGTTSLFAALDIVSGKIFAKCYRRRRTKEMIDFLKRLECEVPQQLDVHLVMDNLNTHKGTSIQRWFARHPRFHIHYTPTYSSWLNQVERWFGLLEQRQLKRGSHTSVVQLESAIYDFIDAHNDDPTPFTWTKSADDILRSIHRFCYRNSKAHGVIE